MDFFAMLKSGQTRGADLQVPILWLHVSCSSVSVATAEVQRVDFSKWRKTKMLHKLLGLTPPVVEAESPVAQQDAIILSR